MFEEFVKKLSDEFKRELPGFSAQKLMMPLGRKPSTDYFNKNSTPKNSAILILLYPVRQKVRTPYSIGEVNAFFAKTVLILRPENEGGTHAGQISFPGGRFDETDKDLSETALRETEEEIGISRNSVTLIGALTPLYIPVSNYLVHPFVGTIKTTPEFKIHPLEVKELLEVDAEDFFSDRYKSTYRVYVKIRNTTMEVPCYKINGKIIWGATAMIISEISEIIKRMK